MLGGIGARSVEFLNTRAGKSQSATVRRSGDTGTAASSTNGPKTVGVGSQAPKKFDESVLSSKEVRDKWDEATYELAKEIFLANVRKYATCPDETRYPVDHLLASG